MTIIYLKVSINCKVTLNSYNEKLIWILFKDNQDLLSTIHMDCSHHGWKCKVDESNYSGWEGCKKAWPLRFVTIILSLF